MNDVLKTIAKRSSIRAYTDEMLTEEEIRTIVTAGLQAPTARNAQEFHITVLTKKNELLEELNTDLAGGVKREAKFYYGAPALFVISGDKEYDWTALDCGIVVENMHLAATSMGLGSVVLGCIRDLCYEKESYYAKALAFPENYGFQVALAVGHPAGTKDQHTFEEDKQVSDLG